MTGFIERNDWKGFLEEFTKRNQLRPTHLEVISEEVGAQEGAHYLPLLGVSYDPKGTEAGSVEIILGGETVRDGRHITHLVEHVEKITPLVGMKMLEEGLGIESQEGSKILLRFDTLPELPEETSH